jgi:ATP-dependent protease ClpP protease subunit
MRSRTDAEYVIESAIDQWLDAGYQQPESSLTLELLDERKILITTGINAQSARSTIEKLHVLAKRDATRPIDLYLRTDGGWEADAFSVIDTIQTITPKVNVHAIGEVHSAGLMLLASGTGQRIVYPHTLLGYHASYPEEDELWNERYDFFWREYGKIPNNWREIKDGEMHYFTARDAINYGIADQILPSSPGSHKD